MDETHTALLDRIREKRDADGREPDRTALEPLQEQFRSIERTLEQAIATSRGGDEASRDGAREPEASTGVDGRNDQPGGYANGPAHEVNSGVDDDASEARREDTEPKPVDGKKKPGGLAAKPSKREQKERDAAKKKKDAEYQREYQARRKAAKAASEGSPVVPTGEPAPVAKTEVTRSILSALPFGKDKADKPERKPLTEMEAKALKPQLVNALLDYFGYADEILYATVKGHQRVEIWGSIDEEECGVLADALISRGKRSASGAAQVVALVDSYRHLKVGLILAPRFYQTMRLYLDNGFSVK
jgi:hypothetical protein